MIFSNLSKLSRIKQQHCYCEMLHMHNDQAQLHIGGIVSSTTLLTPGNVYALIEDEVEFAAGLIEQTLRNACAGTFPACLITAADNVDSVLGSGADRATLASAIEAGHIAVLLRTPPPAGRADAVHSAAGLIEEITYFGKSQHALIVIDEADDVLAGSPSEQAAQLRDWRSWAEAGNNMVLLIFRSRGRAGGEPVAALLPHMQLLAGLARIRATGGTTVWEIFHWFHPGGVTAGTSSLLAHASAGELRLSEHPTRHSEQTPAADEDAVFAMRDVLLPIEKPLAHWQMIDALDDLTAQAMGAQAATFLIGFTRTSSYEQVARDIFALRKSAGPRLKIVVREVNVRMRQSQELLAIRLGANLVIPAGVSHLRFIGMVAMVQGQVFPHILPHSYEQAHAELMPQQEHGYLPPAEFSRSVMAALQLSAAQRLPCALIALPLAQGLTPIDALRYCHIARDGDLCTADQNCVYLFLPACREGDVSQTLERLFRLPTGDLFNSERRYLSLPDIRAANNDVAARSAFMPDLTAALTAIAQEENGTPAAMQSVPASIEKNGPAIKRYSPPTPAIRRGLTLRASHITEEST